jgi:hypothetical protein
MKFVSDLSLKITALDSELDPGLRLTRLSFAIAEFADPIGRVTAFAPGLSDIGAN